MSKAVALAFLLFSSPVFAASSVEGLLSIKAALNGQISPSAVIYVIARPAGEAGGPPLAVKRIPQPFQFPIPFSLSEADAMMPGTPFQGKMKLTARVSQSGSATPVSPGDIEASPLEVEVGAKKSVKIELAKIIK